MKKGKCLLTYNDEQHFIDGWYYTYDELQLFLHPVHNFDKGKLTKVSGRYKVSEPLTGRSMGCSATTKKGARLIAEETITSTGGVDHAQRMTNDILEEIIGVIR